MTSVSDELVDAFVTAYDETRRRWNEKRHGGYCAPMSDANRKSISPIMRDALSATRPLALRDENEACAKLAETFTRDGREWVQDSLWGNIVNGIAKSIRARFA